MPVCSKAMSSEASEASDDWLVPELDGLGTTAKTHIPAYLEVSGAQVGLPGVGQGENWGKIPINWDAGTITSQVGWVKILQAPVKGETCQFGRHVERIEPIAWQAKQVTYHTREGISMIAVDLDTAKACRADWMTLSNYRIPILRPDAVEKKMADVDQVPTPPTPPCGANILWTTPWSGRWTEVAAEEDPGRCQLPPNHDLWKVPFVNNGCTQCGKRSRHEPNPLVFTKCWTCGMSPAYHHGRCCPARVVEGLAAQGLQVDPKIQERKEKRMSGIRNWSVEAMGDYQRYNNELTEKVDELTRTFSLNVWTAQRDKCKLKHEILTAMFRETSTTEGKIYAGSPEQEWILEFRVAWDKSGGAELDKQLSEEYDKQGERSQKAMQSEDTWRVARIPEDDDPWAVVPVGSPTDIKPLTTPPPNSPPPSK